MMIDISVNYTKESHWTNLYFLLTVGSAISMFMVNSISNSAVQGTSMSEGVFGLRGNFFTTQKGRTRACDI